MKIRFYTILFCVLFLPIPGKIYKVLIIVQKSVIVANQMTGFYIKCGTVLKNIERKCGAFRHLVPFVQIKKREKKPHGRVLLLVKLQLY